MDDLDKLIKAVEGGSYTKEIAKCLPYPNNKGGTALLAYSGSLDAAKALHDALLPGWFANLEVDRNFAVVNAKRGLRQRGFTSMSDNPARAWLIAILKAYRAVREK